MRKHISADEEVREAAYKDFMDGLLSIDGVDEQKEALSEEVDRILELNGGVGQSITLGSLEVR